MDCPRGSRTEVLSSERGDRVPTLDLWTHEGRVGTENVRNLGSTFQRPMYLPLGLKQ